MLFLNFHGTDARTCPNRSQSHFYFTNQFENSSPCCLILEAQHSVPFTCTAFPGRDGSWAVKCLKYVKCVKCVKWTVCIPPAPSTCLEHRFYLAGWHEGSGAWFFEKFHSKKRQIRRKYSCGQGDFGQKKMLLWEIALFSAKSCVVLFFIWQVYLWFIFIFN